MTKYRAKIKPLNAAKIGTEAHGYVEFTTEGDNLHIKLEMFDTPANIQHWEHFHGFPDGKDASVPTEAQDVNHDGYIDLPETEPVSGTTMVPLDAAPHEMNIPNDNYPVADATGYYSYEKDVPLAKLEAKFKEVFHDQALALDKRVVYVHGVPAELELPTTVAGKLNDKYEQHVTLPIAAGKIERLD
ncbi:hypothetical protein [Limosilactobacillus fermentum]|uniref:hypothetical protein n=1 Tax=Limosilactobacillus fermentum TaxID=1613 RepID=UPI002D780E33|nr:hypothetical protein [Limosilactobacillus fermentum]WRQ24241.1 hypothetical protein U5A78_09370 [Limosilactobacillus fermentum]